MAFFVIIVDRLGYDYSHVLVKMNSTICHVHTPSLVIWIVAARVDRENLQEQWDICPDLGIDFHCWHRKTDIHYY
jgi:hypothetical protein